MAIRSGKKLIFLGLGILILYVLSQSLMPSDRRRVESLVEKGRAAIEAEDIDTLMGLFDLGYRDEMGLTYAAWKRLFADAFERYDDIRIRIIDDTIRLNDEETEATVTLSVRGEATLTTTRGQEGEMAYRPVGAADNAKVKFRKTPLGWKLHSASNLRQSDW